MVASLGKPHELEPSVKLIASKLQQLLRPGCVMRAVKGAINSNARGCKEKKVGTGWGGVEKGVRAEE